MKPRSVNPKVVVLDGDLGNSTGAHDVKKAFPERFFNIGIAEANMVGIGAGLASCGYIPILTSLGSFLWYNAYDQIRLSVALAGLNVKFLGSHSGFSTGREGPSSMGTEDIVLAVCLAADDGASCRATRSRCASWCVAACAARRAGLHPLQPRAAAAGLRGGCAVRDRQGQRGAPGDRRRP